MRGVHISLDRAALRSNVGRAREIIGDDVRLMFAVKSNAYGHGMGLVAPEVVASGAAELAVLDIATGVQARQVVSEAPLLAWLLGPDDDYAAAINHRLELGVSTRWQLDGIATARPHYPVVVHLKVDTGLHRNGATPEQWPELVEQAKALQQAGVITVRAIWSHLADTSLETSREALTRLHHAAEVARRAGLEPDTLHLAASHAAIELPEARLDMVRLGVLGYGVSPFEDHTAQELGFQPVLTLHAPVVAIDEETVTLGLGYTHGLLPPHSPEASLQIAGRDAPVITVEAGKTRLRATGLSEVSLGDEIAVLGAAPGAPSVEQWARWSGTIGDEVLVRLRPDIPRAFLPA